MSVATKNPFDALGNDIVDDTPIPEPRVVDKTSTHTAKRNTDGVAPSKGPAPTGNRRGGAASTGNEAAFRDRQAGRDSNRDKTTEEGARGGRRGGMRGGRGGRREAGDRHPSKAAPHNSEKQAAQSWGANEGNAELKDEQAGEEIAQTEKKEAAEGVAAEEVKEEEPEDNHISYQDYLVQQAEKKAALEAEAALRVRKPNEGVKDDKWKDFAPIAKSEEEELFPGSGGKAKRERERKTKQLVQLEDRFIEAPSHGGPREGGRGGRGGPRGGARGDGPRGGGRGRGAPRGEFRGEFRGGRGGGRGGQDSKAPINTKDESAFPSLGK